MHRSLLVIDDDVNILKAIRRELCFLNLNEYQIYTAQSAPEALQLLDEHNIQVIISDQRMPNMLGTELLSQVKAIHPFTVRMILSGYADFSVIQEALNEGEVYKFLNKPWKTGELTAHVQDAFNHYDLHKQSAKTSRLMNNLIEAVMLTDIHSKVQSVNTAFCLITEYEPHELIGSYVELFDRDKMSTEDIVDIYEEVSSKGVWQGDAWFMKKWGGSYLVFLSVTAVRDEDRTTQCYLYTFIERSAVESIGAQ